MVGFGLTAGPVLDRLLDRPRKHIEILDSGSCASTSEPLDERHLSGSPGLSVPMDRDWIEFTDGAGPVQRLQKWWAANAVGGGAWLWYGQLSRFHPSDLDMPSLLPTVGNHSARPWPMRFADLIQHFERVEEALAPYGAAYGMTEAEYRAADCAHVVLRPQASHFERQVIDRLQASGMHPYVGQTALGGRAFDVYPIDPLRLRDASRRHPFAVRRTWLGILRDRLTLLGVRLTTNATVARLIVDAGAVRGVEAVLMRADGEREFVRIRTGRVVLACGALETIRILLMSDLHDRRLLLGRSFTLTQERVAYLKTEITRSLLEEDIRAGLFASVVVKEFYQPEDDGAPVKCGKFALYDGYAAELPYRHVRNLGLSGHALAELLAHERDHYLVKVSFKGESLPWDGKYVELGRSRNSLGLPVARLCYRPHPYDIRIQQYAAELIDRFGRALGATARVIRDVPKGSSLVSAHHHGGAIFGDDARTAVVDPHGECFDARGVFLADSSTMPTSGATNSSLTAMALADRLGSRLGEEA